MLTSKTAEMTDFATDPGFRGRGLAVNLLHAMETEVKKEGGLLAYTIARAISKPINTTFARFWIPVRGTAPQ